MKTLTIITGIAFAASMSMSAVHAGSLTTDELFDYLQSGDENSIAAVENVEFSKMEFRDVQPDSSYSSYESATSVLDVINSD